ncbi:MAG TPA: hypothetical protein VKD28_10970 [Gemmatimonadales bacterium]|nr:hypothetical protein [Gemmatimonadales bacterium]
MVGGGCYGTFYASQLAKAKARGKTEYRTVIVVDRNPDCRARRELGDAPDRKFVVSEWTAFFDEWLPRAPLAPLGAGSRTTHHEPDDQIVPSPHMPHLMFEWVLRRARERWPGRALSVVPVPGELPTPYDRPGTADQTRYVSWADWVCPTHCIEPALCPAIGAPRTWEMSDTVTALAERLRAAGRPVLGPALFLCKHQVFGVGMFSAESVRAGDRLVEEAGAANEAEVLVGTISSCHGALNLVKLGPRTTYDARRT